MSYSLTKHLPSCNVERKLLLELESYSRRKIAELTSPSADGDSVLEQTFTVADKFGTENLKRVEEYQRSYFPDDTKRISIETKSTGKSILSIEIKFGLTKSDSELTIKFDGNSAREVTIGMATEIFSIIESYKTANHLFNWLMIILLICIPFAILYATFFMLGFQLSDLNTDSVTFQLLHVMLGGVFGAFAQAFSVKMKPYSAFETRRNEKWSKYFNWLILGLLGFILFTVIGVFLRQKFLGF